MNEALLVVELLAGISGAVFDGEEGAYSWLPWQLFERSHQDTSRVYQCNSRELHQHSMFSQAQLVHRAATFKNPHMHQALLQQTQQTSKYEFRIGTEEPGADFMGHRGRCGRTSCKQHKQNVSRSPTYSVFRLCY